MTEENIYTIQWAKNPCTYNNKYRESWELTMFNVRKGIDFKYNCTILRTTVCLQWQVCSLRWQPAMMFTWRSLFLPFIAWLYSIKKHWKCLMTVWEQIWWKYCIKRLINTVPVVLYVNVTCYSIVVVLYILRIYLK